jgi:hypothetical protein
MFGYKNHVGVDREHGLLRRYTITHAAAYDGGQLGAVLDRDNTGARCGPTPPIVRRPTWPCSSAMV